MKRPFKGLKPYHRDGETLSVPTGYDLGHWASYATLRAAIRGVRMGMAELEADGLRLPLETVVRYEHYTKSGKFKDSEIVAIWKRGRFVWRDSRFNDSQKARQ